MSYKEFMKQNALESETEKFVVSKRFLDENGKPMEWELRNISRIEDEEILKSCVKIGSNGVEVDKFRYLGEVIATSVVHPNLNDVELQNSYCVKSRQELLRVMLTAKEFYTLQSKISFLGKGNDQINT